MSIEKNEKKEIWDDGPWCSHLGELETMSTIAKIPDSIEDSWRGGGAHHGVMQQSVHQSNGWAVLKQLRRIYCF